MGVFVIEVAAQEVQDTIFGKYKHKWENENSGEIDGKDLCTAGWSGSGILSRSRVLPSAFTLPTKG